jgi:hypothetical protein
LSIRTTLALSIAATLLWGFGPAAAHGTVTVTKSSGVVKTYDHVRIQMFGASSLRLTSADGRGTLTIDHAACSYSGDIKRCLPDLQRGTVYFNTTDAPLTMRHSSTQVPAHSIVLALRTEKGTLIAAMGRIDGESK